MIVSVFNREGDIVPLQCSRGTIWGEIASFNIYLSGLVLQLCRPTGWHLGIKTSQSGVGREMGDCIYSLSMQVPRHEECSGIKTT